MIKVMGLRLIPINLITNLILYDLHQAFIITYLKNLIFVAN